MIFTLLYLYVFLHFATAFPENLTPITNLQDVPQKVFYVDDVTNPLFVRILKKLEFGGISRIALAAREKLYFLDSSKASFGENKVLNFTEAVTWKSKKETRDLCSMKGQPQEFCYNYLSILETKTDDVLILCGTNSYSPQCANFKVSTSKNEVNLSQDGDAVPGRQISPFGPSQSGASLFAGDSLYSATYQSFLGGTPVLSRTMGVTPSLRTETTSTLMKDPEFVKITQDDDRVLVFFNEEDSLPTGEIRTISQVAQVCKNDEGGKRVLQQMFTTFLKSRLNCSYNGFYLDQVRDVTDPVQVGDESVIFAAFATPDNSLSGSAVCSFNLSSIHSAMSGPFLIKDGTDDAVFSTVPPSGSRHPGRCPEDKATDSDLIFVRSHSQMEKHVIGSLLLTNQGLRWTAIAVDVISNLNDLPVLFVGTEDGRLVRALPPSSGYPRGKIISDQNIFDLSRCSATRISENQHEKRVKRIIIEGDTILVGFKHCVISVPLRWCSPHLCKSSCLRSSDPYCAWNGSLCVPLVTPDPSLEQDINSNSSALVVPCQANPTEEVKSPEKTEEEPSSTQPSAPEEFVPEKNRKDVYSFDTIIIVGAVTSAITLLLIGSLYIFCYCCLCKKRKSNDPEKFNAKQLQQQHTMAVNVDEKHNSLSRTAHKTFCGMKTWFWKTTTPVHSPEVVKRSERSHNEYTPAPTVHQKLGEKPRLSRIMSSRLNSTSSVTSREDSVRFSSASQPLMERHSQASTPDAEAELTLPRKYADQPTLPLPPKSSGDSSTSSGVSSQSSGSSPVFPENGNGAAESGVFPTASAKLRRRNEYAARKTSEIMREPETALENLEDAYHNLNIIHVQGDVMSDNGRMQSPPRYRLDSQDSGRGDSCRNSIRTEYEQAFVNGSARPQRPASLNVVGNPPDRRKRLHSEGSHPYEHFVGAMVIPQPQVMRERKISGTLSNHSQASTPTSEHSKSFIYQLPEQPAVVNVSTYSMLPKEDSISKPQSRDILRLKELKNPELMLRQPIEGYFAHPNISTHPPPYHNEPVNTQSVPTQYSHSNVPVNYYPSLQVRGAHAQPLTVHPQKVLQNRRMCPPQNYYPSLPAMYNKPSHLSNRYSHPPNYSSLERQKASGKKRQSVPLTRHISMPASERPVGFVSPLVPGKSG